MKYINYTVDLNKVNDSWITRGQRGGRYKATKEGATTMRVFGIVMLVIFIICCFL